eukprot:1160130-Pelagomonas_calceolata.AAC.8
MLVNTIPEVTRVYHLEHVNMYTHTGGQAPGTSEEERAWAFRKFGFEFDVYDKIDVNGPDAHPLYKYLKKVRSQKHIKAQTTIESQP